MDWFLYDNGLRHERVNEIFNELLNEIFKQTFLFSHGEASK